MELLSAIAESPCSPSPCRNGGNCSVTTSNSYTCTCVLGFTGSRCETDIDYCASYPCDPFGRCKDGDIDYTCSCFDGYEPVANSSQNCTVKDYCVNSACENDGICVNQPQLSRYYCTCPASNVSNELIVGLRCETRIFTSPRIDTGGISPKSGILAGGALLLIRGTGLALYPPLGAYFETDGLPTLYGYTVPTLNTDTSITILSPRATDSYANAAMLVTVQYTGPKNITGTNLIFTYTGNPKIDDINPKTVLAAGGIELTVTGSNMDVVENPTMQITTIIYNISRFELKRTNTTQRCTASKATQMTCLMPEGVVPEEFLGLQNETSRRKRTLQEDHPYLIGHRRVKRDPAASVKDSTGERVCELYIGFILDALRSYENTSKSNPDIQLNLITGNPVKITAQDKSVDFDPTKNSTIGIAGTMYLKAAQAADYKATVGGDNCAVHSLTDNLLTCLPPIERPSGNASSQLPCDKDTFKVQVHVSVYTLHAYCLKYKSIQTDKGLIIGLSVAAIVLFLVIICFVIAIIILLRRKKKVNEVELRLRNFTDNDSSTRGRLDESEPAKPDTGYLSAIETSSAFAVDAQVEAPSAEYDNNSLHRQPIGREAEDTVSYDGTAFDYEPNDPALAFDLTKLEFKEEDFKIPRLNIGRIKRETVRVENVPQDDSFF